MTSPHLLPQTPTPPLDHPELIDQDMPQDDPIPWTDTEEYKQNCQLWINLASEIYEKLALYFSAEDRKCKEELFWDAADICTHQDKDLLQLQSVSSLTDSNKKWELENMHKTLIDKEYQSLVNASTKQVAAKQKDDFEDYLLMKDFDYYVQHTREQLANPAVPKQKKDTLKKLLQDAESMKWQPKHQVDDDGTILPDSPPPSPKPKPKQGPQKKKEYTRKAAKMTRKGNMLNTRHLQKLLNELNVDNSQKIMKEIHKISDKDRIQLAKQQLINPNTTKPSYAQKTSPKDQKDPWKDRAGGWKTIGGNNKISRPTILPPPPNVFKFFVTNDESTLLAKKQNEEELTSSLNNIISENVEWLIKLGSNHVKSTNWSKDPKAIVVTMTRNIDKDQTDGLPDGKATFEALQEVVLDLFPGATLANRKPRSKLKFTRVPMQHSDSLPMDNGLLYHYIHKHPTFENVRFSLTPRFERPRPLKPGQTARTEFTKTVSNLTETPVHVKNLSSDPVKTRRTVQYANNGITLQSSANPEHTSARDAVARIPQQCTKQLATNARKELCVKSDA
ncbi:hypothetical protein AMATHDRAFT_8306 [Amanita thiersii Skay4041]|uniref:Uncharacterized protein n=1 Tax=Amanita thiersii Skay4041 TaxID=703135 RepID=A0A2A9NE92_9AGAR|nr:hypothetical protein AMATHDRAFT_8306 [Amanita thiersii Skay4041]